MVPAPAIIGKARGTIDTESGISSLKKFTPSTISKAIKKMTKEPAMAKDLTSTPIIPNNFSPTNKKAIINTKATTVAFSDCICPAFVLSWITTGMAPTISMIAKRIIVTESISLTLKKDILIANYELRIMNYELQIARKFPSFVIRNLKFIILLVSYYRVFFAICEIDNQT